MQYELSRRKRDKIEEEIEVEGSYGKRWKVDIDVDTKENLIEDAKERKFYDPFEKSLTTGKKRLIADLQECVSYYIIDFRK